MMGVGLAISALGAAQQTAAAKENASFQAKVANNNVTLAERAAVEAERRGDKAASLHRLKAEQLAGRQLVALAGQGVDVSAGSSIDLLADTAELAEFDAQVIKGNAAREAFNARAQGSNFSSQANLLSAAAANQDPAFAGASTFLQGAGKVASGWYQPSGTSTGSTGSLATAPNGQMRGFSGGVFGGGV